MIQVQVRILATRKLPISLEIDILEREDANENERKIATAIEALVLKMTGHVAKKTNVALETKILTKQSDIWVHVTEKGKDEEE